MNIEELTDVSSAQQSATGGKFGAYYLQEMINSGGMAEIWVATDSSGKTFAIKRMHQKLRFSFGSRKRFMQGCDILSKIHKHDLVIGYVEHGKTNGYLYCVMEYVESSNLKLLAARNDPALTENVGNILIDMAEALEHLHDSGFMHLDYKPENILVTRSGNVRLVDFDLARPIPNKPIKLSENPGTPAYMAPEQLQRHPLDHRVDIFAYGVTAYELLTGNKPYPGDTADEILKRQMSASPLSITSSNPEVPASLEKIVLKCLERDPDKRYPSMTILVRDLKLALYVS